MSLQIGNFQPKVQRHRSWLHTHIHGAILPPHYMSPRLQTLMFCTDFQTKPPRECNFHQANTLSDFQSHEAVLSTDGPWLVLVVIFDKFMFDGLAGIDRLSIGSVEQVGFYFVLSSVSDVTFLYGDWLVVFFEKVTQLGGENIFLR